jgi:hypothetical protein
VQLVYLAFADLNQALLGKNIDAMMQSEPQSSQAINKGFGVEVMKPYDTPIGEPVRTMVMTEKFYKEKRPLAEKFMRCFVQATKTFIDNKAVAEKYVREVDLQEPDHRATTSTTRSAIRPTPTTSRPSTSRSPPTSCTRRRRQDGQAAGGQGVGQDRPAGASQEKPEHQVRRRNGTAMSKTKNWGIAWSGWWCRSS